jgi:hypothetical protein
VPFEVVAREGVVYAPPIVLTTQRMPQAVLIGRCRVSREPNSINVTAVNYTFDHGVVNINELVGLTVGTAYDITFLIFG